MRSVALAVLLVGCGGGGDLPGNNGVVNVTVLAYDTPGTPNPGVTVFFQNSDSSLEKEVQTDVNGDASASIDSGGFVTVVGAIFGAALDVRTVAGVQPGDHIQIGLHRDIEQHEFDFSVDTDSNVNTVGQFR